MNSISNTSGSKSPHSQIKSNTDDIKPATSLGKHKVSISGLDKADVMRSLFNNSHPQGMGIFNPLSLNDMSIERARELIATTLKFDYVDGRVLKVDISNNELDTRLYDKNNGENAGLKAIQSLIETK